MKKDITTITIEDLNKKLEEIREEIREMHFKVSGIIKDSFTLRKKKKEVARILTELRARTNK